MKSYIYWERLINKGTVGLVKKVIQRATQKPYAVKIIRAKDDELIHNMIVEFKHLTKLDH